MEGWGPEAEDYAQVRHPMGAITARRGLRKLEREGAKQTKSDGRPTGGGVYQKRACMRECLQAPTCQASVRFGKPQTIGRFMMEILAPACGWQQTASRPVLGENPRRL